MEPNLAFHTRRPRKIHKSFIVRQKSRIHRSHKPSGLVSFNNVSNYLEYFSEPLVEGMPNHPARPAKASKQSPAK
jgi:hypothetical protein